jgi:molybdenum cofactor biosynthesis enzyme MoaA
VTFPLPALKFLITNSCNIRCGFCHNEFQGNTTGDRKLDFDVGRTAHLLHTIAPNGIFSDLKISGGEPLTFFESVQCVLMLSQRFAFSRRILVSNLLLASSDRLAVLAQYGVREIRVNMPALDGAEYGRITGTSPKSFSKLLGRIEAARGLGFRLRANLVVSQPTLAHLQDHFSDRHPVVRLLDEIFFVIDYRSSTQEQLEKTLVLLLTQRGASRVGERKGRITEYELHGSRLSVARCTTRECDHDRDFYIRPPGVLLASFTPGFAYEMQTPA